MLASSTHKYLGEFMGSRIPASATSMFLGRGKILHRNILVCFRGSCWLCCKGNHRSFTETGSNHAILRLSRTLLMRLSVHAKQKMPLEKCLMGEPVPG